jgi:hypothetical protein
MAIITHPFHSLTAAKSEQHEDKPHNIRKLTVYGELLGRRERDEGQCAHACRRGDHVQQVRQHVQHDALWVQVVNSSRS